jgi:dihydrofolate reductase
MRKIILQEFVTIDNFAAGPNGETDFIMSLQGMPRKDMDNDMLDFIDTVDTILMGSVTYKMFAGYWPNATTDTNPIADKLNATPKIVFSQTLDSAPWGKWGDAKVVKSDAASEIDRLKQLPGKNMVVWGSISLSHSLIKAGLIDEYQLRVMPVVLGKGKQLFPEDAGRFDMKLVETKTYDSGMAVLRYQAASK